MPKPNDRPNASSSFHENHQPVVRGSIDPTVLAERGEPADVHQHHRDRADERQHHDQRLDELDVPARPHAAQHGVETGAGQQRGHRHHWRHAEHRGRDLADGLELRGEEDRVGDDDEGGGQRPGPLAGEAGADVVRHGQGAEPSQLGRHEQRGGGPAGPDAEPDPGPAHAGQVEPAERANERAGADLRCREDGAADPRADGPARDQELHLGGRAAVAPERHAEDHAEVGEHGPEQDAGVSDHRGLSADRAVPRARPTGNRSRATRRRQRRTRRSSTRSRGQARSSPFCFTSCARGSNCIVFGPIVPDPDGPGPRRRRRGRASRSPRRPWRRRY